MRNKERDNERQQGNTEEAERHKPKRLFIHQGPDMPHADKILPLYNVHFDEETLQATNGHLIWYALQLRGENMILMSSIVASSGTTPSVIWRPKNCSSTRRTHASSFCAGSLPTCRFLVLRMFENMLR
eukprot:694841-Amphidinium_carterae.1